MWEGSGVLADGGGIRGGRLKSYHPWAYILTLSFRPRPPLHLLIVFFPSP